MVRRGARPGRRWRGLAGLALLMLTALVVHAYATHGMTRGTVPEVRGRTLEGRPVLLSGYRGRPVVVYFWATWCPVCRLQTGAISGISVDYPVLAVAIPPAGPEEVRVYVERHGLGTPVLIDASGEWARAFGVRAVPATFVVDGAGAVRFVEAGYTSELGLRLRLWLAGRGGA